MAVANSLLLLAVLLLSQFPQSANSIASSTPRSPPSGRLATPSATPSPAPTSALTSSAPTPPILSSPPATLPSSLLPPPPTPFSTLRAPTPGSPLPTVLPHRDIARRRQPPDTDFVTAGSVDVVLPGIFYVQDIAVHGLAGILVLHRHEACGKPVPPPRSTDLRLPPYPSADPPENPTPAPSPTAELFLMVPQTPTRVPSRGSRPTLPAAVFPSDLDGIQPPMEPGIAPRGISPAIGSPITPDIVSPGRNPAPSPTAELFPMVPQKPSPGSSGFPVELNSASDGFRRR